MGYRAERYRQLLASLKEGGGDEKDRRDTNQDQPKTPKATKGTDDKAPGSGKRTTMDDGAKSGGSAKKTKVEED